jgi:hypothetical protein
MPVQKKDKTVSVSMTSTDYELIKEYALERDWTLSKAVGNLIKKSIESMRK